MALPNHGRLATLEISDDGGSTYTAIGGLMEASLSLTQEAVDVTDKDSGAHRAFIAGHKTGTIEASGNWEDGDTGLVKVLEAFENQTTPKLRFRMEAASGKDQWVADAVVTDVTEAAPLDDKATMDFTFQLSGAITRSDQA